MPEILLTTIDVPAEIDLVGEPTLVDAHLCRPKKRSEGESNAATVSDALPFIEYDIYKQLLYKLRVLGLNAIFGLKSHTNRW